MNKKSIPTAGPLKKLLRRKFERDAPFSNNFVTFLKKNVMYSLPSFFGSRASIFHEKRHLEPTMFYCQLCTLKKRHARNSNLKTSYFSRLCYYCRDRILKSDARVDQPLNPKSHLLQPILKSVEGSQDQPSLITAFSYQDLPQILIHNFNIFL